MSSRLIPGRASMSKKLTSKKAATPAPKKKGGSSSPIDLDLMQSITDFMAATGLVEFDVKTASAQIRLRRGEAAAPASFTSNIVSASAAAVPNHAMKAPAEAEESAGERYTVKSPFVGTFYRSAGPNQDSFVDEGKIVSAGDTLCIVEAMKLMNEIESDVSGRITRVLVKNSTPVEFGEPLFEIAPL
jgi:acetyl-CoA carboxylase biotin carboxyl carrier protein